MELVKFGIVGAGAAWSFHSAGTKNYPKIKFVSAFDVNERNLKKVRRSHNVETYTNYDKFLNSDIDAVLVMVPHYLHEEMVVKAAEAGKHVLCEKPMATTLEACDNMIRATTKAGVNFMIAENHRFLPAHKYIKDAINSGLIGDVFLARAYEGVNEIPGLMKEGFWKGDPIKAGGGALMDMGAHKFATLNWIIGGTVDSASCWLTKQCTNLAEKAEDNALVMLKYESGVIAEVSVSFTVISTPTNSLEIYGTKGTILENHEWEEPVKIFSNHEQMGEYKNRWYRPIIEHGTYPKYYEISARIEDTYFAECILEDKKPEFTLEQAREAIANVLLSYLSAKRNQVTYSKDLFEVYNSVGTISILEGLEKFVQNNYCIEKNI